MTDATNYEEPEADAVAAARARVIDILYGAGCDYDPGYHVADDCGCMDEAAELVDALIAAARTEPTRVEGFAALRAVVRALVVAIDEGRDVRDAGHFALSPLEDVRRLAFKPAEPPVEGAPRELERTPKEFRDLCLEVELLRRKHLDKQTFTKGFKAGWQGGYSEGYYRALDERPRDED